MPVQTHMQLSRGPYAPAYKKASASPSYKKAGFGCCGAPGTGGGFAGKHSCNPLWDDFFKDETRETDAQGYYQNKWGVPIPERVRQAVTAEGWCSKASLHKQIDGLPPKAGDVAANIPVANAAGGQSPIDQAKQIIGGLTGQTPQVQLQAGLKSVPTPQLDQVLAAARGGQAVGGVAAPEAVAIITAEYQARGLTPPWPIEYKIAAGAVAAAVVGAIAYYFLGKKKNRR